MNKDPRVYLAQILERIDRINEYTSDGEKAFFADGRTQDAVIRNFEVIGEAAKRIPEEYRRKHEAIPWRELASFRDILIHQYEPGMRGWKNKGLLLKAAGFTEVGFRPRYYKETNEDAIIMSLLLS